MSTIIDVIEPASDGTLHLPVPAEWQNLPIRIKAEMELADSVSDVAYSTDWENAFGSISDITFEAPARCRVRAVEALDAPE